MNDNKNMILAVVLSAIVLLGWGLVTEYFMPKPNPPAARVEKHAPAARQGSVAQPGAVPAAGSPAAIRALGAVLAESPRVRIETPRLSGSINLKGARVDDLVLTDHRETVARTSPPVRLFSPAGTQNSYFGSFGWSGGEGQVHGPDTIWQADGTRLTPATPVNLSWSNGQGQAFRIRLSIDENYLIEASQTVVNRGAGAFTARPYSLVSRVGKSHDVDAWTMHVGPMGVFNGAADYSNNYDDIAEAGEHRFSSRGGWVGFTDKYWLAAVIPGQNSNVDAALRFDRPTNRYQAEYIAQPVTVPAGAAATYTSHMFAGAKEVRLLEAYSYTLGTQIERAIDWGWFRWFMKPIFSLLVWLFAHIGNFGVAIICLVVIVRTLLFPVAQKQFASMAKMRIVQPKMKALQDRHKDDRGRLQEEMMKLYREEKVNPMAGCLPILLQIPIMYALYKVLLVSVEMRHEPFALWIHDLSAADPLTPVNLFGLIPFHPPALMAIGVLPILVAFTIWVQQKLNPQMPDPVQRQMFALMPWVLMVVMAPFAAGLQIYWLTNNLLSILQQRILYARHPVLKQAMTMEMPGMAKLSAAPPEPTPSPPSPPPPPPARRGKQRPKAR